MALIDKVLALKASNLENLAKQYQGLIEDFIKQQGFSPDKGLPVRGLALAQKFYYDLQQARLQGKLDAAHADLFVRRFEDIVKAHQLTNSKFRLGQSIFIAPRICASFNRGACRDQDSDDGCELRHECGICDAGKEADKAHPWISCSTRLSPSLQNGKQDPKEDAQNPMHRCDDCQLSFLPKSQYEFHLGGQVHARKLIELGKATAKQERPAAASAAVPVQDTMQVSEVDLNSYNSNNDTYSEIPAVLKTFVYTHPLIGSLSQLLELSPEKRTWLSSSSQHLAALERGRKYGFVISSYIDCTVEIVKYLPNFIELCQFDSSSKLILYRASQTLEILFNNFETAKQLMQGCETYASVLVKYHPSELARLLQNSAEVIRCYQREKGRFCELSVVKKLCQAAEEEAEHLSGPAAEAPKVTQHQPQTRSDSPPKVAGLVKWGWQQNPAGATSSVSMLGHDSVIRNQF